MRHRSVQMSSLSRRVLAAAAAVLLSLCGGCAAAGQPSPAALSVLASPAARACGGAASVGYRVVQFAPGRKAVVWYPSTASAASFAYSVKQSSSVALDGAPAGCGRMPLILFSHGWKGCAIQSIFITEQLARYGFIVAAPDHLDAACDQQGRAPMQSTRPTPPFFHPEQWTDDSYGDRHEDMVALLDHLLHSPEFGPRIDAQRIGLIGHSLGGYTVLGMAGGWKSWYEPRVRAVLALSPYADPYLAKGALARLHVPVMYQGAQYDMFMTAAISKPNGFYDQTAPPKYYVQLNGGTHFAWTNFLCGNGRSVTQCVQQDPSAAVIDAYALAFFQKYLQGISSPLLQAPATGVAEYRHQDASAVLPPK
ncbi:MAG: alpha/beta fold hydrolase [Nevskia sp.]|nr:alpha/beta fold hydrolase [Nevskia sp.]